MNVSQINVIADLTIRRMLPLGNYGFPDHGDAIAEERVIHSFRSLHISGSAYVIRGETPDEIGMTT